MKRKTIILLSALMLIGTMLVGCDRDNGNNNSNSPSEINQPARPSDGGFTPPIQNAPPRPDASPSPRATPPPELVNPDGTVG
jgi:hypothetical protein